MTLFDRIICMYLLETLTRTKKEEKKKDFPQWSVLVGSTRSTSNKSTYTANIIECSHMFRSYVNIYIRSLSRMLFKLCLLDSLKIIGVSFDNVFKGESFRILNYM